MNPGNQSSDGSGAIINPRRGSREEGLPPICILVFTPQDMEAFIHSFPTRPRRTHRIFLVDVYVGNREGTEVAFAGPIMGAPQAIMVLEKIVALGVREIVGVGWCGSLQPNIHIGDIVLPFGAISEEGTSKHYPISVSDPGPSERLTALLMDELRTEKALVHRGIVWSTDAPYRETEDKVLRFQKQGILGVDMESSALFTVASFRSIEIALALVVSDDLSSLKWVTGFKNPSFQRSREALVSSTLKGVSSKIREGGK